MGGPGSGHHNGRPGMREQTQQILAMRQQGMTQKRIADSLGCCLDTVKYACRKYGLGIEQNKLTESQIANYVSRSGFDYVSGYQTTKKPITVRCRDCGRTFERLSHIFRDVANGTWPNKNECPLCREDRQRNQRERIEQEKKVQREHDARIKAEQRAMKEADLISRQLTERLAIHVCKNCGKEYCIEVTGYNSVQYCSEKCMKRWAMRVKNDRRLRKMKAREHDTDITLEKLFGRDGGVCYLCGKQCDWSDMTDGNAEDSYPSIDHVVPIAKGGTHTWENIRLAHRRCNWEKRDADYIPVR